MEPSQVGRTLPQSCFLGNQLPLEMPPLARESIVGTTCLQPMQTFISAHFKDGEEEICSYPAAKPNKKPPPIVQSVWFLLISARQSSSYLTIQTKAQGHS